MKLVKILMLAVPVFLLAPLLAHAQPDLAKENSSASCVIQDTVQFAQNQDITPGCDGKQPNDPCTVTVEGATYVNGQCISLPDGNGELNCIPMF